MTDHRPAFVARHLRQAQAVPCHCGVSHRVFPAADVPQAALHVTEITDSQRHAHADKLEYYYILEGSGKMELGGEVIDLEKDLAVLIHPGTPHRAWGNIKALIVMVPVEAGPL